MRLAERLGLTLLLLLSSAVASGNPSSNDIETSRGERVFRLQCGGCHSIQPEHHVAGPSLYGVVGRRAGKLPGFDFSPALHEADFVWTREKLDRFLSDPNAMLPDTRMVFWGLDAQSREQVIDYLEWVAAKD